MGTAHELFESVRGQGNSRLFRSPEHARDFLLGYTKRYPHFIENDLDLCWKQGQYMTGYRATVNQSSDMALKQPAKKSLMGVIASTSNKDIQKSKQKPAPGKQDEALVTQEINKLSTGELTQVIMAATCRMAEIQAADDDVEL